MFEHWKILALTQKRVKSNVDSAIKEHLLFCNHSPNFVNFSFPATNSNYFKATLMESLLNNRDQHNLIGNRELKNLKAASRKIDLIAAKKYYFYHMSISKCYLNKTWFSRMICIFWGRMVCIFLMVLKYSQRVITILTFSKFVL